MQKTIIFLLLVGLTLACNQKDNTSVVDGIKAYQLELNMQYADREKSPLTAEDYEVFRSLEFFEPNLDFRVKARFELNAYPVPITLKTTTDRKPVYQKYGTLYFQLQGQDCQLSVYEMLDNGKGGKTTGHFLFVPFTDLTNGDDTYGGGRYMDFDSPDSEEVIIDFNKTYNPYCAYNHDFSCPIPPRENDLQVAVKAGVKKGLIKR